MLSPSHLTVALQPFAAEALTFVGTATPLGHLLLAATAQGVCFVHLGDTETDGLSALSANLPGNTFAPAAGEAQARLLQWSDALRRYLHGESSLPDLPLHLRGTAFQAQVWQALRAIPHGETRTYTALATSIAAPAAVRAVASACAANPAALLVPCHRVLRQDGTRSGYRWGVDRKRALLALEGAANNSLFAPALQEVSGTAGVSNAAADRERSSPQRTAR